MFTNPQNPHTRRLRRGPIVLALAVALVAAGSAAVSPALSSSQNRSSGSYGWPVKPFHQQHPVRGNFGDPRTVFSSPPTLRGVLHGSGNFSFHQGIDISAPDGTAVYPVMSGVVALVSHEWVRVQSGDGRVFEYWHITAAVHAGQSVEAYTTVVGHIKREAGHVHLTVYRDGRVVNPLAPGEIAPYEDHTRPQVDSISFRTNEAGREAFPNFVRGRVLLVATAHDMPTMRVPGIWRDLPVSPALITWRIQRWTGKVVVPRRVARDVRVTEPQNDGFWQVFARGTYQNMSVFGRHYSYLLRGVYDFKLTARPFDTRQLHDGVYDLVVTAVDTRGNRSSLSQRFLVHNRPGWTGNGS
jgi:murein DD-endopeptidase MepM/ murein hydrolase activator NlpD